ncbi:MAG: hypothetical protein ABIN00_08105 [candidate division WOR-3 bacterium]
MVKRLNSLWEFLKGKKTYVIGLCGLVWGLYQNDKEIILVALGLMGLRHGLESEVDEILKRLKRR